MVSLLVTISTIAMFIAIASAINSLFLKNSRDYWKNEADVSFTLLIEAWELYGPDKGGMSYNEHVNREYNFLHSLAEFIGENPYVDPEFGGEETFPWESPKNGKAPGVSQN